jgi:hypothetical protein
MITTGQEDTSIGVLILAVAFSIQRTMQFRHLIKLRVFIIIIIIKSI